MIKLARSYILSILLTTLMTSLACGQDSQQTNRKKPSTGDVFPHFQLTDTDHQSRDTYSLFEEQPIVLIYYRGGW